MIRIPRHFHKNICFRTSQDIKVLRLISNKYPKSTYQNVVFVKGQSDIKVNVLEKFYKKGKVCLDSIEKQAASPIFIFSQNNKKLLKEIKNTIYIQ